MKVFKTQWQSLPVNIRTTASVVGVVIASALAVWGMTKIIEALLYYLTPFVTEVVY